MTEAGKTNRGFGIIRFKDEYGVPCSVQESSSAEVARIWIGTDSSRMHINQAQAAALVPILQHFVETGELPAEFDPVLDTGKPLMVDESITIAKKDIARVVQLIMGWS